VFAFCMLSSYVLCFPMMQKVYGPEMDIVFNGKPFVNILLSNVSETQGLAITVHNCSDHHHSHLHHLSPSRLRYMTGGTCSR
jgi:hypothetical protein